MPTATLKARFITPCFCGGSDQTKSEIRTLSIRGQMRWWYRICGADAKTETALFGSAETGKSPLMVRIGDQRKTKAQSEWERHNDLKRYLWYFLAQQKRKPIPEGTEFDLMLMAPDEKALAKAIAIAAVWTTFGALGSRSTRAAGCMKLVRYEKAPELVEKLNTAFDPESLWNVAFPGKSMPFEFLIKKSESHNDGLWAAKWLAKQWKELRSHDSLKEDVNIGKFDHDEAYKATTDENSNVKNELKARRPILGMPYNQQYKKGKQFNWIGMNDSFKKIERMASPIHLRTIPIGDKIYPALLIFKEKLKNCPQKIQSGEKKNAIILQIEEREDVLKKLRSIFADERSASCHS